MPVHGHFTGSIKMKKQVVNCLTGETEVIDMSPDEIAQMTAIFEANVLAEQNKQPTLEDRLESLEAELSTLKNKD